MNFRAHIVGKAMCDPAADGVRETRVREAGVGSGPVAVAVMDRSALSDAVVTTASATQSHCRSTASISPGSIRNPRILSW